MVVGVCRIELFIPNGGSLKAKRQVVKSLKDRIKHRFNVAIAEVEDQELWQKAVLGIACVSNAQAHAREMLDRVVGVVEGTPAVEVVGCEVDVM